jgi:CheY-like chemotaxis protein
MILIIENEDFVRENILELLEAEGLTAIGAKNGSEGIKLAQYLAPHLIVCDVLMPDLDGYEVLNRLRQQPNTANLPFIFLSARTTQEDTRQGLMMGANGYLTKPFTAAQLLGTIRGYISQ